MLRRNGALLALLTLLPGAAARAQGGDDGVRRPEPLTSGVSDQLLGQLTLDEKAIFFLSNRNTTNEIYTQDLDGGKTALLFDEEADVTWPRLSRDGRRLLYISYRDDATAQLCFRDLPRGDHRRCLPDIGGVVQAEWIDDAHVALVARASSGDLQLLELTIGSKLATRAIVQRNLTSPAISPDGRWAVYVPIERAFARVTPGIAARAARRLEAVRLDRPAAVQPMPLDLPGLSGQPAFARDGKFLYVSQFLNDSNGDGDVDAEDHGVLFRVAWDGSRDDAPARVTTTAAEQLTDSGWNCQYPQPGQTRLIATCSRTGALQVYGLPLDGEVPTDWTLDRLRLEIELSSRAPEQLLLYRRLLDREPELTGQRRILMQILRLHLDADEFAAAEYYARKIKAQPDPKTAGVATALAVLIEQRRAEHEREHGRIDIDFAAKARKRFERLDPTQTKTPASVALRRVVRSEIADSLGELDEARRELETAPLDEIDVAPILDAYYRRADALYRKLDDRPALVAACARLAVHPRLSPDEQLRYARSAARALVRGSAAAEAEPALAAERARVTDDSELAFALDLQLALLHIQAAKGPLGPADRAVRDALVGLYRKQVRPGRRRAVVMDGIKRANDLDLEAIVETLTKLYVDDAPKGSGERLRATRLYERAMLGRAYRRLAKGRFDSARDVFRDVAKVTGSLEAHLGYLDQRLRAGTNPDALTAEYAAQDVPETARHFASAYLLWRQLRGLHGKQHADVAQRASDEIKRGGAAMKTQVAAQALRGAIWHECYLEDGAVSSAQKANTRYLTALELAQRNPRYKARLLGQLELLQTQVGNYRIAESYAEERDKLPVFDDASGLAHRLTAARLLYHVDRTAAAATTADEAIVATQRAPTLSGYRTLALDRAALYHLALGHFARARELYTALLPLLSQVKGDAASRNLLVARLARAATELGTGDPKPALDDLDTVDRGLDDPLVQPRLTWPHISPARTLRSYRLISSGIRANAHLTTGDLAGATHALERRRTLAVERQHDSGNDEHLRAVVLVETRLADLARRRNDPATAGRWVQAGLGHADDYVRKVGLKLSIDQLDLLRLAAEVRLSGGKTLAVDLPARFDVAHRLLLAEHDPKMRIALRWHEVYLPLVGR